jgi:hypothetical protein
MSSQGYHVTGVAPRWRNCHSGTARGEPDRELFRSGRRVVRRRCALRGGGWPQPRGGGSSYVQLPKCPLRARVWQLDVRQTQRRRGSSYVQLPKCPLHAPAWQLDVRVRDGLSVNVELGENPSLIHIHAANSLANDPDLIRWRSRFSVSTIRPPSTWTPTQCTRFVVRARQESARCSSASRGNSSWTGVFSFATSCTSASRGSLLRFGSRTP